MARANVPKFGNWENENNVPYTIRFENARKNRGGKMINPNDPEENPDMFRKLDPAPPAPGRGPTTKSRTRSEDSNAKGAVRPMPGSRVSREENDFKQFVNSPARSEKVGQRNANESKYGGPGGRSDRSARPSTGSEHSIDRSPLHPHYQPKVSGRGNGSPAWEGKSSYDSSHGTPGRSRLRPAARIDESPDRGAAVPRFGEWDENDPQSGENFTYIFDRASEEKKTGPGYISGTPKHPSYGTRKQHHDDNYKKCCFPWW